MPEKKSRRNHINVACLDNMNVSWFKVYITNWIRDYIMDFNWVFLFLKNEIKIQKRGGLLAEVS